MLAKYPKHLSRTWKLEIFEYSALHPWGNDSLTFRLADSRIFRKSINEDESDFCNNEHYFSRSDFSGFIFTTAKVVKHEPAVQIYDIHIFTHSCSRAFMLAKYPKHLSRTWKLEIFEYSALHPWGNDSLTFRLADSPHASREPAVAGPYVYI